MKISGNFPEAKHLLLVVVASAVALGAGWWLAGYLFGSMPDLEDLHGLRFSEPRALTPFTLTDHHGVEFGVDRLKGKWSYVFFGYTHCPDVCPTTMSVLNSVAGRLDNSEIPVQYIFISVDPVRDTPEQLGQFVSYFNGDFIGVTGTDQGLESLTRQLGVAYMRVPAENGTENYLIDHTASVLLFDPDGRFHANYSPPLDAAGISEDLPRLVKAYP
jgi:protein SCO1/2